MYYPYHQVDRPVAFHTSQYLKTFSCILLHTEILRTTNVRAIFLEEPAMADSPSEEFFEISVSGSGVSIKKSVNANIARDIISIVMGGATDHKGSPGQGDLHADTRSRASLRTPKPAERLSLREYLDDVQAKKNAEKIVAIAEFLITHEAAEEFTKEGILSRFRQAGETPPANFHRDFSLAVKSGWVAEDPAKSGSFFVTKKGRTAIEQRFSGDAAKASSSPKARRKPKKRGETDNGIEE